MRSSSRSTPRGGEALRIDHVRIAVLRPSPDNPRRMPAAEMAKLERSLREFGCVEPIVVRREDHTIIGGHQRLEAAKALGLSTVPVVFVDLPDSQAKALNLALNRIQGEWDLPKLGALLEELQSLTGGEVDLTGFDPKEIDGILAELDRQHASEPREETFALAAQSLQAWLERAPTRVGAGERWQLGRHRLLCGDCLQPGALARACDEQPMDLVLTDPPYGIDYQSTQPGAGRRKKKIANDGAEGFEDFLARALPIIKSQMRRGAVLYWFAGGGGPTTVLAKVLLAVAQHFDLLNTLVWDKVDPGLGWRWRRSWEAIVEASVGRPATWHGGKDLRNVLRFPRAIPQAGDHPTPKPIPLLEELIRAAAPARGRILDPFAGSGSTLIAAERTGRACYAVELEPRYCDLVLFRWEALSGASAQRLSEGKEAGT